MKQTPSVILALLIYLVSYCGIVVVAWTQHNQHDHGGTRRSFVKDSLIAAGGFIWQSGQKAANAEDKVAFEGLLSQIQQARKQLDGVPALIDQEKWDGVRAYVPYIPY